MAELKPCPFCGGKRSEVTSLLTDMRADIAISTIICTVSSLNGERKDND